LLWHAIFKTKANKEKSPQASLFVAKHRAFTIPTLESNPIEEAYDQIELLGFPLCTYFDMVVQNLQGGIMAKELYKHKNKEVLVYGAMVHTRYNTTSKGDRMRFTTMLDREGNFFDCVHFPLAMAKSPIHGKGVYACYGTVTEEFGFYSLTVSWTKKLALQNDPRYQQAV